MSGTSVVQKRGVSKIEVRGACPLCTLLRHFQAKLVERNGLPGAAHLCNYHAWSLARSAPAEFASNIFLKTLRARQLESGQGGSQLCDFCEALKLEEDGKLQELVGKMRSSAFLDWMRMHGTLCLRHADRILPQLPASSQPVVAEVLARTLTDLEQDLEEYARHANQGEHTGGGVLGRAAEFLVSQRGIPGEEPLC